MPNIRMRAFFVVCTMVLCALTCVEGRAQSSSASLSARKNAEARLRDMIGKVYIQAEIKSKGATSDERSYRFAIFDAVNGYARVLGPFEGYNDFFLLRGGNADYLLFLEYTCGTACAQRAVFHRFKGGFAPVLIPLTGILDLSQLESVQSRLLSICVDSDGNFNTERSARDAAHQLLSACPYVLSFPKKGADAVLFKIINSDGSDMRLSVGKTIVSPRALLRWNGEKLIASVPDEDKEIILNSARMGIFF